MTMTNHRLLSILLIIFSCAVFAAAQYPSLADVGSDKYTSELDGFEIAAPHQCFSSKPDARGGRAYLCDLKEGRLSVLVDPGDPAMKTEADILAEIKKTDVSSSLTPGVTLVSQMPVQIGEYRGVGIKLDAGGDLFLVLTLYAVNKPQFTISARTKKDVKDSEKLILNAVSSFKFTTPKAK